MRPVSLAAVQSGHPTNAVGRAVHHIGEWSIDKLFASSAIVAPAGAIIAVIALLNGQALLGLASVLVAALGAVGIHARFIAPFQLKVTTLARSDLGLTIARDSQLPVADARPRRIVFFSDLHVGEFKRQDWVRRVVDLVNAQSPDVVLIGGDFVGRTECCHLAELLEPLCELRAPHGAYGVLGNHDHGMPGPDHSEELARLLPALGVRLMRNECAHIDGLRIIGVEEIWTERDDLRGALERCADAAARTVVLGHNPDLLLRIDAAHPALHPDHTLFLFGHTHQGQIHIPFLPGLAVPIESNYYRGIFRTPYGAAYVSSGVGENTTPTRLNTRPEIVVIDL